MKFGWNSSKSVEKWLLASEYFCNLLITFYRNIPELIQALVYHKDNNFFHTQSISLKKKAKIITNLTNPFMNFSHLLWLLLHFPISHSVPDFDILFNFIVFIFNEYFFLSAQCSRYNKLMTLSISNINEVHFERYFPHQ